MQWIFTTKEDHYDDDITQTYIKNRNTFTQTVFNWKIGQRKKSKNTGQFHLMTTVQRE